MFKNMNIVMVAMMSCVLMFAGCSAQQSKAEPSISITVDAEMLEQGQVVINSVFDNPGPDAVTFLPWGTPFESMLSSPFLVISKQVSDELLTVPYEGIMIKRAPPQNHDYLTVNSRQMVSSRLDITKSYRFCRGLPYIISYAGPLLTLDDYKTNSKISIAKATAKFSTGDSFPLCDPIE